MKLVIMVLCNKSYIRRSKFVIEILCLRDYGGVVEDMS